MITVASSSGVGSLASVLSEEEGSALSGAAWIERLQIFSAYLSATVALIIGFTWMGHLGNAIALGTGLLCLVGLIGSHFLRILLGDFYRQFQYREKFFLFLFHAAVVVCPYFFFRLDQLGRPAAYVIVLSILLVVLNFQAIDRHFFGRIHAVQFVIVMTACFFHRSMVALYLPFIWFPIFMISIRFSHLMFRLDEYGEGRGIELSSALWRGIGALIIVMMCGGVAWWLSMGLKGFHFQGFTLPEPPPPKPVSISSIYLRAFFLCIMVVALLILMKWIDEKFMRKKGPPIPFDEEMGAGTKVYRVDEVPDQPLAQEDLAGPREKILTAFRDFSGRLHHIDMGRAENETVADYFLRLEKSLQALQTLQVAGSPTFNKACYDSHDPSVSEADEFVVLLNGKIRDLRASQGRLTPPEH